MNIEKIPAYVLAHLIERGLTRTEISVSNADKLFSEYCNWHGLSGWGPELASTLDALREAEK